MSAQDVDSSSEDEADYKATNVTLGYASAEATGDDISRLGGHPTWLDDNIAPTASLAKCKVCNGLTSLLLLLNADLQQHFPHDDRRLHVVCCRKKACSKKSGSIRAFREVRKPLKKEKKQTEAPHDSRLQKAPEKDLGTALFGDISPNSTANKPNPFSLSNGSQSTPANPFSSLPPLSSLAAKPPQQPLNDHELPTSTFAEKLRLSPSTPTDTRPPVQEPWPDELAFPPAFPRYFLDAGIEELEPEQTIQEQSDGPSKAKYDAEDSSSTALDKDTFESSLDKTFQKFSDRIAQNPEQVLRYEFKGQPLLYSGSDGVASRFVVPHGKAGAVRGIPRCESCGAQRVFELQLLPGLIYELEKDEATSLEDGMEWGTIIVGTCANNCGEIGTIGFREEWVGVQWEEWVARK